jgi:tocopherol cyclase
MLLKKINAFFSPEQFQGWGKKRNYFEGWYFKIVSADEKNAYAIIPGIAMDKRGNRQAFIQVLDGKMKTARYHRFDAGDFLPAADRFYIAIKSNSFSEQHLQVDLPGLKGTLQFCGNIPWPKKIYSPGIMGPYAFAPFMECYHGIVSMNHAVSGALHVNDKSLSFDGGRGYIEKDWGRSFPSAYFWMQSNHFSSPGVSLKCSVAKIPWVTKSFTGFIGGLWLHDRLFRFTTYNGTKLRKSFADEKKVELVLENTKHRLEILAHRDKATALASPIGGLMDGRIEESMTATMDVLLTDKKSGAAIFHDTGRNAGLEVAGKIEEIFWPLNHTK